MFDVYSGILKMADCFRNDGADLAIKYLIAEDYSELCETYNLLAIAGSNDDFCKATNLLEWISSNIFHCGDFHNNVEDSALKLFEYSFGKGEKCGINCRSLSLVLTECLLAIGIKARTVYILPLSPYDGDNHVICEAWIDTMKKWIMLDPTYNLYAFHNEVCLNVLELRRFLANQADISFNDGANYNNAPIDKAEIMNYYAKNLFRFMVSSIQGSNSESIENNKMVDIVPKGYDVKHSILANIDYRIIKFGINENLIKWRKETEQSKTIYKGIEFLGYFCEKS
ncbi:MAG: transglutaminase-like domain-containing protein [Defluviitaleaceae bacterium]|nr:transglutaminase-like domain-containing protein [Defluviitaleaceae bacterium]